ncbi:MAG: energy-coupled thiamine transporter ThiT [Clostridia bacterium]|nr:energy-coupled thiamine transporter ThiT [Clostridia bacterium]
MKTNSKKLVTSAMLIAIAVVLSLFTPFNLPFGGGITLASCLPIILIAFMYGTKFGLFSAFIFSLLQMVTGMNTVASFFLPGDSQMVLWRAVCVCLLDYVAAYTVLGFGGIFKNKLKNHILEITIGSVFALLLRYVVHIISGAVFFGAWAEWFFTQEGFYKIGESILTTFSDASLSLVYSVFYNGLYMMPEIIITAVIAPVIYKILSSSKTIN